MSGALPARGVRPYRSSMNCRSLPSSMPGAPAPLKPIASTGWSGTRSYVSDTPLSESDARAKGIRGGDEITLRSNGTSVTLRARLSRELRPGVVRVPEEFAGELQPNVEVSK